MSIKEINENLDKIYEFLIFLLPKNIKFVNEFIKKFKNFFSDKEILNILKNDADYEKVLDSFIKESSKLVGILNELRNFLKEENIEDKDIFNLINETKADIMDLLSSLEKKETSEIIIQQNILDKLKELNSKLLVIYKRRKKESEKEFIIETSSYFRKQRDKKDFVRKIVINNIEKIKDFAKADKIPSKPQAAEPPCYGGAPHHLNSVVIGIDRRLVFYRYLNESGNIIRLCAYIDSKTHNDALSAKQKRSGNVYWLIIKHKINRFYFEDFKRINPKTLEDM